MRLGQPVRKQVQLEVGLGGRGKRRVFGEQSGDQWALAFGQTGQQRVLGSVERLQGISQLCSLGSGDADCLIAAGIAEQRSEERRVGKECVSTCRSRWSPYP